MPFWSRWLATASPQPATDTPPVTPSATPATEATEEPAASPTPDAQLTFTVVGDVGSHEQAQATLATMGAQDADFHLVLGDLSYAGPGKEPPGPQGFHEGQIDR